MASSQYKAARFDVMDHKQEPRERSNFMDLTHASGFAFLGLYKRDLVSLQKLTSNPWRGHIYIIHVSYC